MRRRTILALSTVIPVVLGGSAAAVATASASTETDSTESSSISSFPTTISVPNGFAPEGIAISGGYAFLGSRSTGSVYKASLATGAGEVIYTGPGTPSNGLKIDSRGRAFISGNTGGDIRVISTVTGELLAAYQVTAPGASFINDVILTKDAAWFTDSFNATLYKLPIGANGALPASAADVVALPLSGITITAGTVNINGIALTPDGKSLLVVQSNTGLLFKVNPSTGETGTVGTLSSTITNDAFAIPTTVASFGDRLYIVNGKLTTPISADVAYDFIAIAKP